MSDTECNDGNELQQPTSKLNARRGFSSETEPFVPSACQIDYSVGPRTNNSSPRKAKKRHKRRNQVRCWAQCDLRDLIWILLLLCAGGSGLSAGVFYIFIQHEHAVSRRTSIIDSSVALRHRESGESTIGSRFDAINVPTNSSVSMTSPKVSIFYNAFASSNPFGLSAANPISIIEEQLRQVASAFSTSDLPTIYYTTIGPSNDDVLEVCHSLGLTCRHLQHFSVASESVTLTRVHEYCNKFPLHSVVYLHNKGSLHHSHSQDLWRQALTASATSIDCLQRSLRAPFGCNVCGLLFQPLPASHFPGNMWSATCQYVKQLLPPKEYHTQRPAIDEWIKRERNAFLFRPESHFVGKKRYEAEHWIGSHPSLRPCDVSISPNLEVWTKQASAEPALKLQRAPRSTLADPRWIFFQYMYRNETLQNPTLRLRDYFLLRGIIYRWMVFYNDVANQESWVWKWYPDGFQWQTEILAMDDPMRVVEALVNQTGSASIVMPVPTMAQKILQAGSAAIDWMQPWNGNEAVIFKPF